MIEPYFPDSTAYCPECLMIESVETSLKVKCEAVLISA